MRNEFIRITLAGVLAFLGGVIVAHSPLPTDGTCKAFDHRIVACAPSVSPEHAALSVLFEDGSARYGDGFTFESSRFYPPTIPRRVAWFEGRGNGEWEGLYGTTDQRPDYAVDAVTLDTTRLDAELVDALMAIGAVPLDGGRMYAPRGALVTTAGGGTWVVVEGRGLVRMYGGRV